MISPVLEKVNLYTRVHKILQCISIPPNQDLPDYCLWHGFYSRKKHLTKLGNLCSILGLPFFAGRSWKSHLTPNSQLHWSSGLMDKVAQFRSFCQG